MAENDRLSKGARRFLAAMVGAKSIRGAAAVARVGEVTAYRYLRLPLVRAELAAQEQATAWGASWPMCCAHNGLLQSSLS